MSNIQKWKLISDELLAAHALLSPSIKQSDLGYRESDFLQYLSVNELGLAIDELDGVMEDNISPGNQFWEHMIKAASLMSRVNKIEKYEQFKVTS